MIIFTVIGFTLCIRLSVNVITYWQRENFIHIYTHLLYLLLFFLPLLFISSRQGLGISSIALFSRDGIHRTIALSPEENQRTATHVL